MRRAPSVLLALGVSAACADEKEPAESSPSGDGADGGGDGTDGTDGGAAITGVSGTLVVPGAGSFPLVDGKAFEDEGDGGVVRVILGSFQIGCAQVEDGVGFNTPSGEAYFAVSLNDLAGGEIYLSSGGQVNREAGAAVDGEIAEDGDEVVGDITLDDGESSARFRVDNCGPMDPFGS
jgi:hypothetical protein